MSDDLPPLCDVIAAHDLWAKKSLGQHFLLDTNLLAKIVRAAGDISNAHIIEIGPGPGGLTRAIMAAKPRQLTAIEKDARCITALAPLQEIYGGKLILLAEDALKINISTIGSAPRMVIANLPYNVGTSLIIDWLKCVAQQGSGVLTGFTVMLQKEVAQRMVAQAGDEDYGRLSVIMRQYTQAAIMFDVPASSFTPPPKVTSAVLHARILPQPREDVQMALLEKVVASAFNNRRKMLRQSLKSLGVDTTALCRMADIDETWRAEQCDLAAFARLARAFAQALDKSGNI